MKWTKASDKQAPHLKTVLLSFSGIYQVGYFDKYELCYRLNNGNRLPADLPNLLWTDIQPPTIV